MSRKKPLLVKSASDIDWRIFQQQQQQPLLLTSRTFRQPLHVADDNNKSLKRLPVLQRAAATVNNTTTTTTTSKHDHSHDAYQRHVSLELLNPTHDSDLRKSSPMIALFNLVATVCGGGVLTLPLAFARAGIVPTTILMVFAAICSDFCLYILVSCARRTGSRSYGEICKIAGGNVAEIGMNILLFFSLCGALVAFQVLAMQIWTDILSYLTELYFVSYSRRNHHHHHHDPYYDDDVDHHSHWILAIILTCTAPLLLKHDLHALRYTCYVGFASLCLLTMGLVYRGAWQTTTTTSPSSSGAAVVSKWQNVKWVSTQWSDILFAFPIVTLCFYCSYNVLSVHGSLVNPTRERIKFVLDGAMLVCLVLFYVVGLCGYLYALDGTSENILLNFPMSDRLLLLGRIGYGFTILFGLPLITLPCREALLCIPQQIRSWQKDEALSKEYNDIEDHRQLGQHLVVNGVDFDEEAPHANPELQQHGVLLKKTSVAIIEYYGSTTITEIETKPTTDDTDEEDQEQIPNNEHNNEDEDEAPQTLEETVEEDLCDTTVVDGTAIHFLSTFGIVVGCYIAAILVPGVAVVWSICGSTVTFLIGFVIPTCSYLKIRSQKKKNPRSVAAWILLVFFSIATIVCTYQTLSAIGTTQDVTN